MKSSAVVNTPPSAISTKLAYVLSDPEIWSQGLNDALESLGLDVDPCNELHELFERARERAAELVIISQRNAAFAVRACRVIRGLQETPMMVVMPREGDLIPVLDAGADDAVLSRVEGPVFAARVRALLRRSRPASRSSGEMVVRDMVIDLEKYEVRLHNELMSLTPTEFRILAVLAQQAGRVVDPRALLSAVHHHDYGERDAQNLVKVHIANLRRKINDSRSDNQYILCVRGFGYMLERRSLIREDDPLSDLIDND